LTSIFDTDTRKTVLSAYFLAVAALKAREIDASIPKQESALLTAVLSEKASIFALFGGLGTNEVYFDELQNLYDIYKPFVAPFVQTLTKDVLVPLVAEEEASTYYTFGLDIVSWLSGAAVRPAVSYLASVPISFPLIGLTQLVQYLVVCHVANLTPGELRSRLSGATGHSQGIVSAVVIAASGTFEEFADNSHKAIKWLFYSGLRGQQAFPVTSVEPSIVQDAIVGGEPILATYRSIRQYDNISLVAGSGFGSADDVWEYLTGDWSTERFGVQPMPFDGFLFASRVMVAKEAHTSSSVKDLIVAAAGVEDGAWEGTYTKPTGGILTVQSELGEPIHKVATRAVKLWKEFDDTVFKLPKEKRELWLAERKEEIIGKLNKDFAKPWFGWKKDGSVAIDLSDMTYEETVLRMVRLMFVSHEKRWVDNTLRNLTGDWLRRVEERFAGVNGEGVKSLLQNFSSLNDPLPFVKCFFEAYPLAAEQLLAAEDTAYFLAISQRPGQKPVPFIPVLDASFEVWFKKVSSDM
jgi:hypothetical protein